MNPQTKAWLIVICTAVATGTAVTGGAIAGGCKTSVAILTGVGAGASAVLHALLQSPTDQPKQPLTEITKQT